LIPLGLIVGLAAQVVITNALAHVAAPPVAFVTVQATKPER